LTPPRRFAVVAAQNANPEALLTMKQDSTYRTFRTIGLIGLGIQLVVNLIVLLAFKKNSAEFFSEQLYSAWLPGYLVWLVFAIIGVGGTWGGKNGTGEQ
jgi:hypothetical protein